MGLVVIYNSSGVTGYLSDGQVDKIDVSGNPGLGTDLVFAGPEDDVYCDENDAVVITDSHGTKLWAGEGSTYLARISLLRELQHEVRKLEEMLFYRIKHKEAVKIIVGLYFDEGTLDYNAATLWLEAHP